MLSTIEEIIYIIGVRKYLLDLKKRLHYELPGHINVMCSNTEFING